MHTKEHLAEAEAKGFVEVAGQIVVSQRKPLPKGELESLETISRYRGYEHSRNPLQLFFEDGKTRFGLMIGNETDIGAILADYGVSHHEELIGRQVIAHKENDANSGEKPSPRTTLAFSNPGGVA